MPLNHLGFSVWIADSEGNELPEYEVKLVNDHKIECWIPSTEGSNFKIMWKILNAMPGLDLAIYPYLDGVGMTGATQRMGSTFPGYVHELDSHRTGSSTVRLFEFGKRILTDREDAARPSDAQLYYLNTIVARFNWGLIGTAQPALDFSVPQEAAPLNEKSVKKGHSGSAGLGRAVARAQLPNHMCTFSPSAAANPVMFVFRYAPRDWLKARDIIPPSPQPSPSPQIKPKRERSFDSDVIDIDDLLTDDEVVVEKHMVPAPATSRKKHCTMRRKGTGVKTESKDK
ncbi:unnamed protein product [Rhizoctonia solani]|uniref:DUF7918 domain-containing protein n=1 Tax=Rhizoctonia solani TaxID=456999 RepID=A0A8H3GBQ2_9AGAM|nr:unnamed protein product [Rhizoctonia solani]